MGVKALVTLAGYGPSIDGLSIDSGPEWCFARMFLALRRSNTKGKPSMTLFDLTSNDSGTTLIPGRKLGPVPLDRRNGDTGCFWLPTATARRSNDGESLETWLERRVKQRSRRLNGNGMGASLAIVLRWLDGWDESRKGGLVNPEYAEWLMGFPVGWTALPDSETPSSPRSPSGSGDA